MASFFFRGTYRGTHFSTDFLIIHTNAIHNFNIDMYKAAYSNGRQPPATGDHRLRSGWQQSHLKNRVPPGCVLRTQPGGGKHPTHHGHCACVPGFHGHIAARGGHSKDRAQEEFLRCQFPKRSECVPVRSKVQCSSAILYIRSQSGSRCNSRRFFHAPFSA